MNHFPQDGSPITRDAWLGAWPRSKKGNEWVRAFGFTYTISEFTEMSSVSLGAEILTRYRLTVVGPGGKRYDHTYDGESSIDDVKEWLWPDDGCPGPKDINDLELGA